MNAAGVVLMVLILPPSGRNGITIAIIGFRRTEMSQAAPVLHPSSSIGSIPMSPNELAQLAEVAEILGVSKRTAARAVDRADFPEPFDLLATGRVWRRRDVERWAKKNPPRGRGRPPKDDGRA